MEKLFTVLSIPLFFTAKFFGNYVVALFINHKYQLKTYALEVAFYRTIAGVAIGLPLLMLIRPHTVIAFYVALFPLRMLVWHLIFRKYYSSTYQGRRKFGWLSLATIWSYLVDAVASILMLGSLLQGIHLGPCL